jgi:hypothetical protein
MPYFPYIPYRQVRLNGAGMGGIYEPIPFLVPFSSQAAPGDKYVETEISVPAQVSAAAASNVAPANPTAAQASITAGPLSGAFEQQSWTVGPYGLGSGMGQATGSITTDLTALMEDLAAQPIYLIGTALVVYMFMFHKK